MNKKAYSGKPSAVLLLAAFALCMAVPAGCGREDSEQENFYMMEVQVEEYPRIEGRKFWNDAGRQFYKDEAVQFWSESEAADGGTTVNIYLSHEDGSSEPLLEGMPKDYRRGRWRLDQSGSLYYLRSREEMENYIISRAGKKWKSLTETEPCCPDGMFPYGISARRRTAGL